MSRSAARCGHSKPPSVERQMPLWPVAAVARCRCDADTTARRGRPNSTRCDAGLAWRRCRLAPAAVIGLQALAAQGSVATIVDGGPHPAATHAHQQPARQGTCPQRAVSRFQAPDQAQLPGRAGRLGRLRRVGRRGQLVPVAPVVVAGLRLDAEVAQVQRCQHAPAGLAAVWVGGHGWAGGQGWQQQANRAVGRQRIGHHDAVVATPAVAENTTTLARKWRCSSSK